MGWFVLVWERDYAYDDHPLIRCDNITREEMFAVADEYGLGKSLRRELRVIDAGLDEVDLDGTILPNAKRDNDTA